MSKQGRSWLRKSETFPPIERFSLPRVQSVEAAEQRNDTAGHSGILVQNSSHSIDDILMPGGNPIGVKATGRRASARLREVTGGEAEAEHLFRDLSQGGKDITPAGYPGKLVQLPDGRGTIGYRPASKSGPPTIDVNAVDAGGQPIPIEKINFAD